MKKALILFLVLAIAIAGCKKDSDTNTVTLTVKTKLQSQTGYQSGATVKLYKGSGGGGQLVAEGLTDNTGAVLFPDLSVGEHTILASYVANGGGQNCQVSSSITLTAGSNTSDVTLDCNWQSSDGVLVRTKLTGQTAYQADVVLKLYVGNDTTGALLKNAVSTTTGVLLDGLGSGTYTLTARYTSNGDSYMADSTFQYTNGTNLPIDLLLYCSSCCNNLSCGANGTLNQANGACNCICDAGYEGASCNVLSRDKFLGSYSVNDACSASGSGVYSVTISANAGAINQVRISNFWNAFISPVVASVVENDLTIAPQEPDGDGFFVSGSGVISSSGGTSVLTISYTVEDRNVSPVVTDFCSSTYVK